MLEMDVRAAAEAYLSGGAAHSEAVALGIAGQSLIANPDTGSETGKVVSILVLHAGTAAVAHVTWAEQCAGWLTLLLEQGAWLVISCVTSPCRGSITPADMAAAASACWDEYCGANRACDGLRMANIFHPQCRLTYSGPDGTVVIKPQDIFVQMVSERCA